MKENKYDNTDFFNQYSKMSRSTEGLEGAGEWHVLRPMLPDFKGKRVLDLGCGFGWHCMWALQHGATKVVGVDISKNMLEKARQMDTTSSIEYMEMPIEEIDFPAGSFDVVISSLAFHYVASFEEMAKKINRLLSSGGVFVFSVEHPIFTAYGNQQWHTDSDGKLLHWPVDKYFEEGRREAIFLGEKVTKYHKTLTTYINGLLRNGFQVKELIEPTPQEKHLSIPGMKDELRRPMFLIISAVKA